MDHIEPSCCFDTRQYTGIPDSSPTDKRLDVPQIIKELDGLFNKGLEKQGGEFLEKNCAEAEAIGDWRAELSLLSELMGYYRRSAEKEKALNVIDKGLKLIDEHSMGRTVSAATVILNAATTLKCFGQAEKSIALFRHVSRVFSENLAPTDYRFAGLYNNMALSYTDMGRFDEAEKYYLAAMSIIEKSGSNDNEMAVSLCNLAEMYDKINPEDKRIAQCMEKAWDCLNSPSLPHDGYHAFNISKCIPSFDYFGYFLYVKVLRERMNKIYEGA